MPAVKIDGDTHREIKQIKAKVLLDNEREYDYGQIVKYAIKYYNKNQPWKQNTKEVPA